MNKNKKDFCKKIGYMPKQLRRWLANEERHRNDATVKRVSKCRHQGVARETCGMYPEMEAILAANIRFICLADIPFESWMLEHEGKAAFHQLHPAKYPEPDSDH